MLFSKQGDDMRKIIMRTLCAVAAMGLCIGGCAEQTVGSERVLEIERALYSLGYHDDNFDALLDDVTKAALRSFQRANDLNPSGEPDSATLALLDSGMGVTCHQYLVEMKNVYSEVPILQSGSAGEAVGELQMKLRELGYFSGECDGVFGDATLAAVKRFQMANGLTETGSADRSTQIRLYEGSPLSWRTFLETSVATFGDTGLHVRQLQRKLQELGYFEGDCTGSYGEMTQKAVALFQETNLLENTGVADLSTCAALYEGFAQPLRDPSTLRIGNTGESVAQLQSSLASYGYFDRNVTGIFGATTEIAVRLFQMANGLSATGEADGEMMSLLIAGSPMHLDSMQETLNEQMRNQGESARAVIGSTALRLRGQSFEPDDEDLYDGFAFVQYVCASAGIPVVAPEALIQLISLPVANYAEPQTGDILSIQRADGTVLLAIATGAGGAVYATQDGGYVLETDLRSLAAGEVYRWNMQSN